MYYGALFACIFLIHYSIACDYEVKIKKIEKCKGAKNELDLINPGVRLDKDCNIVPIGCAQLKEPCDNVEVKYEIKKSPSPMALLKGSKSACDLKYRNFEFKCPTKKNDKICAKDGMAVEIPKKALQMAAGGGDIIVKATVDAPNCASCYIVTGAVIKK